MSAILQLSTHLSAFFQRHTLPSRVWLAYSGGVDSHVLLHLLATQFINRFSELKAIHIHHGLSPHADKWLNHCAQICQQLQISFIAYRVQLNLQTGESIEAQARQLRYAAIAQSLQVGDGLFTAQHADDQTETVFLQLLRGSGVAGLSAMAEKSRVPSVENSFLFRPFLGVNRGQIVEYAQHFKLQWIEDESNFNERFERNFLRHQIIPPLKQRWTALNSLVARVAQHQAEAVELLEEIAGTDLQNCQTTRLNCLAIPALLQLSEARRKNVLRFWFKQLGHLAPSTLQLAKLQTDVLEAKEDANPVLKWHALEIRRFRQGLYAIPPVPHLPVEKFSWQPHENQRFDLPLGYLQAKQVRGRGLRLTAQACLTIQFRQGGEIFWFKKHHRTVKKLLQTLDLPTWERPFIPFLYLQQTLVQIAKIGIADNFQVGADEIGWEIEWIL